ncbi:DUF502 domain-containing protein [Persicirhabdus sediminis]|nr:DUF502 domain-containing protein [Persicirhabdus sediminis]
MNLKDQMPKSQPEWTKPGMKLIFSGLVAIAPLVATIWLVVFLYRILLRIGEVIIDGLLIALNATVIRLLNLRPLDLEFPGADILHFLLPIILLFVIGLALRKSAGRKSLQLAERIVEKLPIFGFVLTTFKQVVDAVEGLGGEKDRFKSVAYIEYPNSGHRMIGFVTGNYFDKQTGKDVTAVFVPTSPNPMTGFVVVVDDDKVYDSDMSLEEASKLVFSAGLVAPQKFDAGRSHTNE